MLRLLAVVALLLPGPVDAFTLADGTTVQCIARGAPVPEADVPASANVGFTGRTVAAGSGYRILWNLRRLEALPPAMHDFLFYHECAHAQVPTQEEGSANCAGLRAMRAAGRAGFAVESKLAAFYGVGNAYWTRTLECANAQGNAGSKAAAAPSSPAVAAPGPGADVPSLDARSVIVPKQEPAPW